MTMLQKLRHVFRRRSSLPIPTPLRGLPSLGPEALRNLDLAPNDPFCAYLDGSPSVIDLARLHLDSPFVERLRTEGVRMVVPLFSQGELVGMLSLGDRRSEQAYANDDLALLLNLATHAAPALRVAQLVRQQRAEARERERIAQELRVARLIQQTLLPREVPQITGWDIAPLYEPAREVGGDFYDFIDLGGDHLGLVIADVTDKGVPAALVMAMARSILRAAAGRLDSPGAVLARVNEVLCPDIPPNMFVTCFYAILDLASGHLRFANAGHDLPYWRHAGIAHGLHARGMPLGLMPGMYYEEQEVTLCPGDQVLLYSDGLVEAHDPQRAMFSFGRLEQLVGAHPGDGQSLITLLMDELATFTGPQWVQEDDITLVAVRRGEAGSYTPRGEPAPVASEWATMANLEIASAPDNERAAMEQVAATVAALGLPPLRLERLKTAVAEATMNAMEHGNQYRPDLPTRIEVRRSDATLAVRIYDHGTGGEAAPETPDLEAKLDGIQTPRGWGLHLIRHMVDELRITREGDLHMVELIVHL